MSVINIFWAGMNTNIGHHALQLASQRDDLIITDGIGYPKYTKYLGDTEVHHYGGLKPVVNHLRAKPNVVINATFRSQNFGFVANLAKRVQAPFVDFTPKLNGEELQKLDQLAETLPVFRCADIRTKLGSLDHVNPDTWIGSEECAHYILEIGKIIATSTPGYHTLEDIRDRLHLEQPAT